MKTLIPLILSWSAALAILCPGQAIAQLERYQPNAESKKFAPGSAEERKARMSAVANSPAYTKKFDLSGLPHYVPEEKVKGEVRLCGSNYIGDSPLGRWWAEEFAKFQPDIKVSMYLPTPAIAIPCLYFDKADIGIDHPPLFYDSLAHLRLKGYEPLGISIVTGSYNVIGWTNNFAIIVNRDNPLAKIDMKQLDGIFGSRRAGGWLGTKWHPEFARGPEGDIRTWGQMGLGGAWADKRIGVYGFSTAYETAVEFSNMVLQSSDKWNGDMLAFGNYTRPDGTTYLEADQIVDHVKDDPNGIGYIRYHDNLPKEVKVLPVAVTKQGPYVDYTMENLQSRAYPLWSDLGFYVSVKPGTKMKPAVREFIRYILSQEGQEQVQRDGKWLPLDAKAARAELEKVR